MCPASGPGTWRRRRPPTPRWRSARCGVGRHQFGHAQPDDEDEGRDERPTPGDRCGSAVVPAEAERCEAARKDRDDRERDGEVGKAGPRAVQLLAITEFGEKCFVIV